MRKRALWNICKLLDERRDEMHSVYVIADHQLQHVGTSGGQRLPSPLAGICEGHESAYLM